MKPRICVANRGEIACRIIKTIHKLDMHAIALYSEIDKNARHVQMADEAFCIGPASAKKSYLVIDNVLEVLNESKADGLHPGYGFLSENATFAKAVIDLGVIWIGPSISNMELMSKKDVAVKVAKESGASVLSGSNSFNNINQLEHISLEAESIGFPLLIKSVSGGGGIGMRLVENKQELQEKALSTAKMAKSAFGDESIYLEKYIQRARHIEIQVFGLKDRVLHFYERECSIQRRFQKILEETHAPNIPEDKILEMAKQAIKIADHIGYQGAGTIEFVYDDIENKHYFLEMNTRIQVEHPITEECTNIDLVELQIKHALKDGIYLQQTDIVHQGHSMECRLYAENPAMNFLPSPGKISKLSFLENAFTRVDRGINEGDDISFHYDSMVAKIITKGKTRKESITNMQNALSNITIEGVKTNIQLLQNIMTLDSFMKGDLHTQFIQKHLRKLLN